jgi:hypothetical protein
MSTHKEKEIEEHEADDHEQQEEEEEHLDEETQNRLKNLKVDDSAFQQDDAGAKKQKAGKSGKVSQRFYRLEK